MSSLATDRVSRRSEVVFRRGPLIGQVRSRTASACVVIIIALLATACGGGNEAAKPDAGGGGSGTTTPGRGPGSSSGPAPAARILDANPCALVNAEEVGSALGGGTATSGTIGAAGEQHTCDWRVSPRADYMMVTVNDIFCDGLIFALDRNLFTDEQKRIDDIGQGGMIVENVGGVSTVSIKAKGGCFSITGKKSSGPLPKATLLQLARTATGRL